MEASLLLASAAPEFLPAGVAQSSASKLDAGSRHSSRQHCGFAPLLAQDCVASDKYSLLHLLSPPHPFDVVVWVSCLRVYSNHPRRILDLHRHMRLLLETV
jgi:hypothetical protein